MARIAVAVSGGIDSLFALYSLYEQGHDVFGVHGLFLPHSTPANVQGLQAHCDRLQIPLHIVDMRKEFDSNVVEPFIKSYAQAKTPNPCALCNATMKFGLLMQAALELGADFFATGHYATKNDSTKRSPLSKGVDSNKDQSYFLALTPKHCFKKIIFPLASTKKTDNFLYLQQHGFDIAPSESQEICFIPNDAYRPFLQKEAVQRNVKLPPSGPFIIKNGQNEQQIGEHKGLWQYTEGQRRGLGIAWKEPLYVCSKDIDRNAILLGPAHDLALHGCLVTDINYFVEPKLWPSNTLVKVRYRQQEALTTITWQDEQLHIKFHEPQSPTACGQVAVIYDEDGNILAGGIISKLF